MSARVQREIHRIVLAEHDAKKGERKIWEVYHAELAKLEPSQRESARMGESLLTSKMKTFFTPWFRDMIAYDPRPVLQEVRCPVLALHGEKDARVRAEENLRAIAESLAAGGNQQVTTLELPGLNHLFQTCSTGSPMEYATIDETFNLAALDCVSTWIHEITKI